MSAAISTARTLWPLPPSAQRPRAPAHVDGVVGVERDLAGRSHGDEVEAIIPEDGVPRALVQRALLQLHGAWPGVGRKLARGQCCARPGYPNEQRPPSGPGFIHRAPFCKPGDPSWGPRCPCHLAAAAHAAAAAAAAAGVACRLRGLPALLARCSSSPVPAPGHVARQGKSVSRGLCQAPDGAASGSWPLQDRPSAQDSSLKGRTPTCRSLPKHAVTPVVGCRGQPHCLAWTC